MGGEDYARAILVQNDGRIVVLANTFAPIVHTRLMRYHPDGTLDTTFGDGGVAIIPGVDETIAWQDGKILVVGQISHDESVIPIQ